MRGERGEAVVAESYWRPEGSERDARMDAVKGILVVFMVLYHTLSVYGSPGSGAFAYIRFVSGSFIFISGYVVSRFYMERFVSSPTTTSVRLCIRGLKLLALFTALNLLINLTGVGNPAKNQGGIAHFFEHCFDVYVTGAGQYASFQILLPIAYLLILSPALLLIHRFGLVVAMCAIAGAMLASHFGAMSANAEFMSLGVTGLAIGLRGTWFERGLFATRGAALAGLMICVFLMQYLSLNPLTYILGTVAVIKCLYETASTVSPRGQVSRMTTLLGRYSLLCYIGQIAFLQGLSNILGRPRWELGVEFGLTLGVAGAFTLGLAWVMEWLRKRYRVVHHSYRLLMP